MGQFINNDLIGALIWVLVAIVAFGMGFLWMVYLMKVAMNEDEVQEKIRKHKRIGEELMRAQQSSGR